MTISSHPSARTEPGITPDDVALAARYQGAEALPLLRAMIEREHPGRIALVSSFGSESAVLLDMVARIDRALPVLFLNTGKLFGETLAYRDRLVTRLGLTDVREIRPDPAALAARDAEGDLWNQNADLCCFLRKVAPLNRALAEFSAWITGRKRFHGGLRSTLPLVEAVDGRIKVNPLAGWSRDDVNAYFAARDLPRHPLEGQGFLSVGCMPCTDRVTADTDTRRGRWPGSDRTECGIHLPLTEVTQAAPNR